MQTKLPTNTWVSANWDEYLNLIQDPALGKAKGYYCDGRMRVETPPIGNDHASDHALIITILGLFSAVQNIALTGRDNCTYRKTGHSKAQPDVSYYIGDAASAIPWGTTIIDLDQYPAPTPVIAIANTSLADDKGEKRLLYEALGVGEYWVVDVANVQILAFAIADAAASASRSPKSCQTCRFPSSKKPSAAPAKTPKAKSSAGYSRSFRNHDFFCSSINALP